jgi:hypothetical protein
MGIHGEIDFEGRGLRLMYVYVSVYEYMCVYVSVYVYVFVSVCQFSSCTYCSQRFTYRARPIALSTTLKMKQPPTIF